MKWSLMLAGMLGCMLPLLSGGMPVYAEEAEPLFRYTAAENGTAAIFCTNTEITEVTIPETIDGYPVTMLGDGCFLQCSQLTSVTIPDSILAIGEEAFSGCSSIQEMTIPASVEYIGSFAFDGMESLTEFHVEEENTIFTDKDGVLFTADGTILVKYPESRKDAAYQVPDGCETLLDWSFIGSQYLQEIDLGQVQKIGEDAFYYCVMLHSVSIPEGITRLENNTFAYCISMEEVQLPSTLQEIGDNCFYSCTALNKAELPDGLQSIGSYAFYHCTALKSLKIPKSVDTLMKNFCGYYYDEETDSDKLDKDFTLYVYKGTAVKEFAKSNGIHYEIMTDPAEMMSVLLVVMGIVIAALAAAVTVVAVKRRKKV